MLNNATHLPLRGWNTFVATYVQMISRGSHSQRVSKLASFEAMFHYIMACNRVLNIQVVLLQNISGNNLINCFNSEL